MKRTETHEPIINSSRSGCSCGRWNGPARELNEAQGKYTYRANDAHRRHVADVQAKEANQTELFQPQLSLLDTEAAAS